MSRGWEDLSPAERWPPFILGFEGETVGRTRVAWVVILPQLLWMKWSDFSHYKRFTGHFVDHMDHPVTLTWVLITITGTIRQWNHRGLLRVEGRKYGNTCGESATKTRPELTTELVILYRLHYDTVKDRIRNSSDRRDHTTSTEHGRTFSTINLKELKILV